MFKRTWMLLPAGFVLGALMSVGVFLFVGQSFDIRYTVATEAPLPTRNYEFFSGGVHESDLDEALRESRAAADDVAERVIQSIDQERRQIAADLESYPGNPSAYDAMVAFRDFDRKVEMGLIEPVIVRVDYNPRNGLWYSMIGGGLAGFGIGLTLFITLLARKQERAFDEGYSPDGASSAANRASNPAATNAQR